MATARSEALADVLRAALDEAAAEIDAFRSRAPGTEPVTELDLRLKNLLTGAITRAWPEVPVIAKDEHADPVEAAEALPDTCVLLAPRDGSSPSRQGSSDVAITAFRIRAGFPVQSIVDLPAYGIRVEVDRGMLSVTGDVGRLPVFAPGTLLTGARHLDRARQMLPGLPVEQIPTSSVAIAMALVALGRAHAAACLPTSDGGATSWDYGAAALAVHSAGGKAVAPDGSDLAHSRPRVHPGWLGTRTAQLAADLAPLMASQC
ncbi:hypothetical protein ABZ599_15900 [Streptomyces misionensis]|uniref:hypothetical protein n=1 Tax=Streptomyces misionensis TaxID=67331 RepID=UPI0033FB488F